jgi:hypothetical protein
VDAAPRTGSLSSGSYVILQYCKSRLTMAHSLRACIHQCSRWNTSFAASPAHRGPCASKPSPSPVTCPLLLHCTAQHRRFLPLLRGGESLFPHPVAHVCSFLPFPAEFYCISHARSRCRRNADAPPGRASCSYTHQYFLGVLFYAGEKRIVSFKRE